jgi:CheY-like chemotaxis protein
LNSLLILAEQLEDNPDQTMTAKQVEYASVILASGRDLLELLNNILDLAKAESGTVTVDLSMVAVEHLRNTLFREFEHVAADRKLGFSIDVGRDVPAEIVTDPQRFRQVLKNLLANAFKFTERGTVDVTIGLARQGWRLDSKALKAAESVLSVAVSDTGIGIGAEEQHRIFEAFAQGDGTTARHYGGTGLGLSISRELVGLLGGEIKVDSTPGEGSTFTVYLPLDRISSVPVPVVPTRSAHADLEEPAACLDDFPFEGNKILVVDDDVRNIFALTALLERGHAVVSFAESGESALDLLEAAPDIDLVLMDIMMPGMDGYDTIRAIRKVSSFKALPIIAVTGKVVHGERERCIDAGADDYVPKPVDTVELLAAVGPYLPVRAAEKV